MLPVEDRVFLGLGSNAIDAADYLRKAIVDIEKIAIVTGKSSLYRTAAWGLKDQPDFVNAAIEIRTGLSPDALLLNLQQIEEIHGRVRMTRWGPRTLDLDILFFGSQVIAKANLIIPHPLVAERRFVLQPVNEIAAEFKHPVAGKTIQEMLSACPDDSKVEFLCKF